MAEVKITNDVFTDIDTDFDSSPVTDDVLRIKNVEAIKRSIRNIVLTNKGERPFNPIFGSNIKAFLFENASPFIKYVLAREIEDSIRNFEPRASEIKCKITGRLDANELIADVSFTPINSTQSVRVNLILERSR